jgi:hypothetical protein
LPDDTTFSYWESAYALVMQAAAKVKSCELDYQDVRRLARTTTFPPLIKITKTSTFGNTASSLSSTSSNTKNSNARTSRGVLRANEPAEDPLTATKKLKGLSALDLLRLCAGSPDRGRLLMAVLEKCVSSTAIRCTENLEQMFVVAGIAMDVAEAELGIQLGVRVSSEEITQAENTPAKITSTRGATKPNTKKSDISGESQDSGTSAVSGTALMKTKAEGSNKGESNDGDQSTSGTEAKGNERLENIKDASSTDATSDKRSTRTLLTMHEAFDMEPSIDYSDWAFPEHIQLTSSRGDGNLKSPVSRMEPRLRILQGLIAVRESVEYKLWKSLIVDGANLVNGPVLVMGRCRKDATQMII